MQAEQTRGLVRGLGLVGLAVLLGCLGLWWLAVIACIVWASYGLAKEQGWSWSIMAATSTEWIGPVSLAVLLTLNSLAPSRLLMSAFFTGWTVWRSTAQDSFNRQLLTAAVNQFLLLAAVFSGAALRHWPTILVIAAAWLGSFLVADRLLATGSERSRTVLASAWALVVAECSWVFSVWLVNYVLLWLKKNYLVIPQAAIVLTALGYCFGGIYVAHRGNKLSRARLVEYLLVGLALLATVIAGTEWNRVI